MGSAYNMGTHFYKPTITWEPIFINPKHLITLVVVVKDENFNCDGTV
jgi:hypothetical protein